MCFQKSSSLLVAEALPPQESYSQIEGRITAVINSLRELPEDEQAKVSISSAARFYKVPYDRLNRRWKGLPSKSTRKPTNRKLSDEQENALWQYLKRLDEIGTCALLPMVTDAANFIIKNNHPPESSEPPPVVGEKWTRRFLARHPEFNITTQKSIDAERKVAQTPEVIRRWFDKLWRILIEKDINISDIYNADETGCRVGVGRDQKVITLDSQKVPCLGTASSRKLVTLYESVSADGFAVPPMVIIPGSVHLSAWYNKTGSFSGN